MPYQVLDITDLPEVYAEQMGSKDKFWVEIDGDNWLFKLPRSGTGEHWAERVVGEIATCLGLPAATVELAARNSDRGTVSRSFLNRGDALVHGNELMAAYIEEYDPAKQFKQREHRLDLVLECIARNADPGPEGGDAIPTFVGYLVLDALVGNVDRHHENWALVQSQSVTRLAPTYDHASSLGRELSDKQREDRLRSWGPAHYLDHGRGGIYAPDGDREVPPSALMEPLDSLGYAEHRARWCSVVAEVGLAALHQTVDSVPNEWISKPAREFAKELLTVGFERTAGMYG